jgi:septal ring factor EnvC (AmiA/AmiB activator)
LEQHSSDISSAPYGDTKAVEASLRALWERVRRAGEAIVQLREEKKVLLVKVEELEQELHSLRKEVAENKEVIGRQASELAQTSSKQGAVILNGEREELAVRVKNLLTKLDAYL